VVSFGSSLLRLNALRAARRFAPASIDEARLLQGAHLRALIRHAYERVPYYRELFDNNGIAPGDIRTPADLWRVPVTTRGTVQARGEEMFARGIQEAGVTVYSTSGSAGQPLKIPRGWLENRTLAAIRFREMTALGIRARDRVVIAKTVVSRHAAPSGALQRLLARIGHDRWDAVDCLLEPNDFVARLETMRPHVLAGYPGHIARIAQAADGARLRALGLRLVCTGGEVLTAERREAIATAFGAPVRDTYASFEFDLIARECPVAGGYHVCEDGVILDVVERAEPVAVGARGEVVVTGLHGYAMPFIRYALGDVVERGRTGCPCGAAVSTIREIHGRIVDFFTLPDGRVLHPYGVFIPIRERCPWMRRYQVRQLALDHVVMKVVAEPVPDRAALGVAEDMARAAFGPGVRFELHLVAELAHDPTGKFQTYRSHVRP
jgi:phenylacetate-CoA ligase